jgi:glutaminase
VTDLKPRKLQDLLDTARQQVLPRIGEGEVADYIPELAKVDLNKLGIAVATVDGDLVKAGDAEEPFSIQSISKVFTLTLALGKIGDALWQRVGREPSGTSFDSIVQLEHERGLPRNPFINAGAIVVADVMLAGSPAAGGHRTYLAVREIRSRRRDDCYRSCRGALRD